MFGGPAKTAEPIDMPFGMWTWVGPKNHVLNGGPERPMPKGIFMGKDMPGDAQRHCAVSSAKVADPIEMPFGF